MIEATNKALIRRWFDDVWNKGQEATIDKLLAINAVVYGLGDTGVEVHGPEQFKPFVRDMLGSFPDLHISIEDIVAEGDKVIVRVLLEGTHQAGALGVPATGRRVRIAGIVLARILDGQIVEAWNSWDQLGLLRQIGAIPTPAGGDRFVGANA